MKKKNACQYQRNIYEKEYFMRKKTILLLTSSLFSANAAFTSETSSFYIGPQVSAVSLHIGGISRDFRGTLTGATLSYNYQKPNNLYANACAKWALGELHNSSHTPRFLHDESIEGQLGFTGRFGKMELIPFLGFGFHYLIENRQESKNYLAIKTSYRDYYVPLGLKWRYYLINRLQVGVNFTWWHDVDSSVKIAKIKGVHWTLDLKDGYRVTVPIEGFVDQGRRWGFCLEPFWQGYQLGSDNTLSSAGDSIGIRAQTFNYYGSTLSSSWHF